MSTPAPLPENASESSKIAKQIARETSAKEHITGNAVASLFIPGAGQLAQGRVLAALFFFISAVILWFLLLGWVIHIWACFESVRWVRNVARRDAVGCEKTTEKKKTKPQFWWSLAATLSVLIVFFPLVLIGWGFANSRHEKSNKPTQIQTVPSAGINVQSMEGQVATPAVSSTHTSEDFKIVDGIQYYQGGRVMQISRGVVILLYHTGYGYIPLDQIPTDIALKMGADPEIVNQIQQKKTAEQQRLAELERQRKQSLEQERQLAEQAARNAAQAKEQELAEARAKAQQEQVRQKARQAQVAALTKDLNAAIHDLKAWFPKRTKVENYNIIDLTATAICQSGGSYPGGGNPFKELLQKQNNPYGLTEGDIVGILAADKRNTPADTSALEDKIDSLSLQNDLLQDQIRDARDAASDARDAASDASMEASQANSEIERARLFPHN